MKISYTRVAHSAANVKKVVEELCTSQEDTSVTELEKGYSLEKTIPDSNSFYRQSISSAPFTSDEPSSLSAESVEWSDPEFVSEFDQKIIRRAGEGVAIEDLARTFSCSERKIRKVLTQAQFRKIMRLPLDFIDNPEFTGILTRKEEQSILRVTLGHSSVKQTSDVMEPLSGSLSDIPLYLNRIGEIPLLTASQEYHLFRKMNYLKFKTASLRQSLDPETPKVSVMNRIERLYAEMVVVKNYLILCNLRLVVSIAKRHEAQGCSFYDLISDGNMSLMRAVEKFDYGRGNKFSTYASWAITRNFSRTIPDEKKYRHRFHSGDTEVLESRVDDRTSRFQDERVYSESVAQISRFMDFLDDRERDIIERRFGLGKYESPQTLRQIGREVGVTKERVRQIENRALTKLRKTAKEEKLEMPGPY
ncbi:MAG: sigma-70 family RNA polymerase sigma factor [Thermoguttaceae bacterium]|nr:sigma-70 family RNA polymerase sigma factor [Thermoguttaceae bacterium]